jgi:hypothetical protein
MKWMIDDITLKRKEKANGKLMTVLTCLPCHNGEEGCHQLNWLRTLSGIMRETQCNE